MRPDTISGNVSGNAASGAGEEETYTNKQSSVVRHRARKARAGFVRVEFSVRKEDAPLMRQVAAALTDPLRQADARALLRQRLLAPANLGLKELLVSAPLEGIDLERARDFGRDIDL